MTAVSTQARMKLGIALCDNQAAAELADKVDLTANVTPGTAEASKAVVLDASKGIATITSATITSLTVTNVARVGVERQLGVAGAKVGGTAGWVVKAADNLYQATLPASQSGSTLVIPVSGLKVGDTITAFKIQCQIESAGGAVTVDADLRKQTNAAGDPTDASVGTITQVSVTADTKSEAAKTGLAEVVAADEWFYILITATTAASTDIRFLGCTVTVTEA